MDNVDFAAVECYSNNSTTQIGELAFAYNYASVSGRNIGLFCGSETDSGLGTQSYWTGAAGAIATMETAHTAISNTYTSQSSPWTNASFRGQCIDQYASYKLMT